MASCSAIQNPRNKTPKRNPKSLDWGSLPQELLTIIFSKSRVEDVVLGCSLVCRQWHAASLDPSNYRVLDLRRWWRIRDRISKKARLGDLIRILLPHGGPEVECVMFPDLSVRDSDYAFVADRCPNLKFFSLMRGVSGVEFSCAISKWKHLDGMNDVVGLSLYNPVCSRVPVALSRDDALGIIRYLPKLKFIDLSYAYVAHGTLLDILKGCKRLESLHVNRRRVSGVNLEELQRFEFANVKVLVVNEYL